MRLSTFPRVCTLLAATLAAIPGASHAQSASLGRGTALGTVQGTVRDSLRDGVVARARVQLVPATGAGAAHIAIADASGRFALDSVPAGRYLIGFLHPVLDSLGVEAPVRAVTVTDGAAATVDLAIPSAPRLRAALCEGSTTGAVLVGFVRPARRGADVSGAAVTAQWTELSVGKGGIARRTPRRVTTTSENGWFALCNVPGPGTLFVVASRGADSTDIVEATVTADGLLRQDLYLGAAHRVATRDSVVSRDSAVTRQLLAGDGRLTGRVVLADGGMPLRGAQVGIAGGPSTRTNERGEFTLIGLPEGTRTLDVRALGFYPERRAVHVVEDARVGTIALATLRSVLDTMRIRATRTRVQNLQGFMDRMHMGNGRFLTSVDIERRMPQFTVDIFRNQPGVKLLGDTIFVRGIGGLGNLRSPYDTVRARGIGSSDGLYCRPTIFVDGRQIRDMTGGDINLLMNPREIRGVEIYTATQTPPEFSDGLSGCGSIVFWTR